MEPLSDFFVRALFVVFAVRPVGPTGSTFLLMESTEELGARKINLHVNLVARAKVTWLYQGHHDIIGKARGYVTFAGVNVKLQCIAIL